MTTPAQLRAVQAETELNNAKADLAAEAKEALRKQLAAIRAQIRAAKATYADLRKQIRRGEQRVAMVQSEIDFLVAQLTESVQAQPPAADFLPDDPEVEAWQADHDALVVRRDRLIAVRDRATSQIPSRIACARYEGNFGVLANLQRQEINLLRKLRGEPIGAGWQGGVYRVL